MRQPTICICENKDADQLRGNREADQRFCFRYIDSTIPLLSKSEISRLLLSSVAVQPGLSDQVGNQNIGFLMTRLKWLIIIYNQVSTYYHFPNRLPFSYLEGTYCEICTNISRKQYHNWQQNNLLRTIFNRSPVLKCL